MPTPVIGCFVIVRDMDDRSAIADIKPSDVADMQRLYKEKFGMEIDYQTAYSELTRLVRQMELVYRPITKEQAEAVNGKQPPSGATMNSMQQHPDPDLTKRQQTWQQYVPSKVTALFIAEAPPAEERYFYYPESSQHDHLFINMMRAVFPELESTPARELRTNKPQLLQRFKDNGYLLIDAIEQRIPSSTPEPQRIALIRSGEGDLIRRASKLQGKFSAYTTKHSVFEGLSDKAKQSLRVANNEPIPFPSNSHQRRFRELLRQAIRR